MFVARKLVVTLRERTTGAKIAASAGSLKNLPPQAGSSSRIIVNVPVPNDAVVGTYDVLLSAPDVFANTKNDVRFAVRFANMDRADVGQVWNASTATLSTGTSIQVN